MNFDALARRMITEAEERRVLRWAVLGLIAINAFLGMSVAGKETVVVFTPPQVADDSWASPDEGSVEYLKSWALYVAQLAGNVSPGNADFVATAVAQILVPAIYRDYQEELTGQVETIRKGDVTLSFETKQVLYEPALDMYFVTGEQVRRAVGVADSRKLKTYEMKFRMSNYRPFVAYIDAYDGTADLKRLRDKAEKNGT